MKPHDIPSNLTFDRVRYEYERGAIGRALVYGEHLLKKTPNDSKLIRVVAFSNIHLGKFARGRKLFQQILSRTKGEPYASVGLAESYKYENRFDEAQQALDDALAIHRDHATLLGMKAELLQVQGQNEEACGFARRTLELDPANITASNALANAVRRRDGERAEVIDILRKQRELSSIELLQRSTVNYALGMLLDAEGEYDEAFEHFRVANEEKPTTFNFEAFEREVADTIANWTPEAVAEIPRIEPRNGDLPIFILGMPRSGTSLVEQIVSAHPKVYGAGEQNIIKVHGAPLQGDVEARFPILSHTGNVTKQSLEKFARKVISDFRKLDPKAVRITDKMPDNSIRLNIIALGLPQSTVLHTTRHPIDTCLSCYFQMFGPGVRYATRLDALGRYFTGYRRLMEHWKEVLPIEIHDVSYEDLTANQESETRRLIDATGLEWDDACLDYRGAGRVIMTASNEQVRQPIYRSSVERWKRYEKHLGPLIEALGPIAEES